MMLHKLSNLLAPHLVLVTIGLNKTADTEQRSKKIITSHFFVFFSSFFIPLESCPAAVEAGPVGPSRPLAVTIPPCLIVEFYIKPFFSSICLKIYCKVALKLKLNYLTLNQVVCQAYIFYSIKQKYLSTQQQFTLLANLGIVLPDLH